MESFDVVVVGAGMGGLVAAIAAAEAGSSVLLLEKGADPGGSFAISGGYIWTVPTLDLYREIAPEGDLELGRLVVEGFEDAIDWLRGQGVKLGPRFANVYALAQGRGEGYPLQPDAATGGLLPMLAAAERTGARLECRTRAGAILTDSTGRVTGLRVRGPEGVREVVCRSVVLATGGFQGDVELRARYLGPWTDHFALRANPHSTGDGLRLATAAGAAASRGLHAFYGHLLPAKPAQVDPGAFRPLSQYYSPQTVMLNVLGERFVDESGGDEHNTQALSRQPKALGFLVFDDACYRERVLRPRHQGVPAPDPLVLVPRAGGTIIRAGSLGEIGDALAPYGVPPRRAQATIEAYDAAAAAGDPDRLPIPRRDYLNRVSQPPFYAVPVISGITFTHGGVRVNRDLQALDRDGSPVPGLYAAGVDAGNVCHGGYVGGLGISLVTGLHAGLHASKS